MYYIKSIMAIVHLERAGNVFEFKRKLVNI